MLTFPNAKINLGLNIISKRPDGYHNIETVFYPVNLQDALEIVPSDTLTFKSKGLTIKGDPYDNLILKAYRMMQEKYDIPNVAIFLQKNIPMGAGLGGGSSDAAFLLKAVNKQFKLELDSTTLQQHAATLGADCPFFIENKPCFASGLGYDFEPIELDLSNYDILLVKPNVHISTEEAYSYVVPREREVSIKDILKLDIHQWKDYLENDFEGSVFNPHPELSVLKRRIYDAGAIYAAMSGSGSTVYGIFPKGKCPDLPESVAYTAYKKSL